MKHKRLTVGILAGVVLLGIGIVSARYTTDQAEDACHSPSSEVSIAKFGNDIELTTAEISAGKGHFMAQTTWRLTDIQAASDYSLALHLVDELGGLVAQEDYRISNQGSTCIVMQLDMPELSHQEYTLLGAVYSNDNGSRISALNIETGAYTSQINLGTFSIEH